MGLILFGLVFLTISVIPVDGKVLFQQSHGIPQLVVARSPHASLNARSDDLTIYTFDQFIDHGDPSLGTFKQRYWLNAEYYESGEEPTPRGACRLSSSSWVQAGRSFFLLPGKTTQPVTIPIIHFQEKGWILSSRLYRIHFQ